MSSASEPTVPSTETTPSKASSVAPAVVLVAVFWVAYAIIGVLDIHNFHKFLVRFAAVGVLLLAFSIWWLVSRGARPLERLAVLGCAVLGGAIAMLVLRHPSVVPPAVLFYAVPFLITAWTVWLFMTRRSAPAVRRAGMFVIPLVVWTATALVRMDGLSGAGNAAFHWRWTPTAEQQFLAEQVRFDRNAAADGGDEAPAEPLVAGPHDWPRFRGPNVDSAVDAVKIATDWNESPPKLQWRRRIGPAWSSVIVVGNRLFTQEQRGELEAVVCFDAKTGEPIWSHEDKARFSEQLGGDGPRATPTFADGKLYTLGATGILNCLDATTGKLAWSQTIAPASADEAKTNEESAPQRPYWGYASSPLVARDIVIVFAGGHRDDSLRAFHADSGEPAWTASSGKHSYSSPQLATLDGIEQVLYLSDLELTSVDPATGRNLWRFEAGFEQGFPSIQPHVLSGAEVLASFNQDAGTMLLEVTRDNDAWVVQPKWKSAAMKPYFNDFVVYEDALYGFDGEIFACVDLKTGKRKWKGGRYGSGQVLLLADQGLLLVIAENGEVALVAADSRKHRELGSFQAIEGKTWSHPALVDGRLYVRNAEEMACYEIGDGQ